MRLLPLLVLPVVLLLAGCAPAGAGPVEMLSATATSCTTGEFAISLMNHGPHPVTLVAVAFTGGAKVTSATVAGTDVGGYQLQGNTASTIDVTVSPSSVGTATGPEVAYKNADGQAFTATSTAINGFGALPSGSPTCG